MPIPYQLISPETIERSLTTNKDLIRQFIDLYLIQIPSQIAELEMAVAQYNPDAVRTLAHHIKPTLAYIGAPGLMLQLQDLEDMGAQHTDQAQVKQHFLAIKNNVTIVLAELEIYRATLPE